MYEVKVISPFLDYNTKEKKNVGDIMSIDKNQLDMLSGNNIHHRVFVEVVKEIKEDAAPEVQEIKPKTVSNKNYYSKNKKKK